MSPCLSSSFYSWLRLRSLSEFAMILGTNKIAPISISFKNKIQNEQEEFNGMVHDNSIASPTHVTAYVLPI